jgi:hypothetical protein
MAEYRERLEKIATQLMAANLVAGNGKTNTEAAEQAIHAAKKLIEILDRVNPPN